MEIQGTIPNPLNIDLPPIEVRATLAIIRHAKPETCGCGGAFALSPEDTLIAGAAAAFRCDKCNVLEYWQG